MRILQLIQKKQYRGAEIFACQLSNKFLELGHEVKVVSIYEGDADLPFLNMVESLDRPVHKRYYDILGWKKLSKIIYDFQPDVIQANAADTLKYAIFSKMIYRWGSQVIFRNASASSFYIKDIFSKYLNAFLLKQTDLILSVSEASKKDLNAIFPFTKRNSYVLPVGIDENKLNCNKEVYNKSNKNIIHIGSFTKEKNHTSIVTIFEDVNKRMPETFLHLIGDGPLLNKIKGLVWEKELNNSVTFHGSLRDPYPYLIDADLLILPSLVEGLPAVILEAMYCRIPVIAFNVGGIPEIVTESTGILVEYKDEESFANIILEILKSPNHQRVENAFEMVSNHYTNEEIALKFIDAYKKLLE